MWESITIKVYGTRSGTPAGKDSCFSQFPMFALLIPRPSAALDPSEKNAHPPISPDVHLSLSGPRPCHRLPRHPPGPPASPHRLVLPTAAAAPLPAAQAGTEREIAAHAGHEKRERQQRQPAGAAERVRTTNRRVLA